MAQAYSDDPARLALLSRFRAERAAARAEGFQQGVEEGIAEGIERGIERGVERGVERGIERGRVDTARDLFLRLLRLRGAALTPEQRRMLDECADASRLTGWVEQLAAGAAVAELLGA